MEQIKERAKNLLTLFGAKINRYGHAGLNTVFEGKMLQIRVRLLRHQLELEERVETSTGYKFVRLAYEYYAPRLIPPQWEVLQIGCYVLGKAELVYNEKSIKW